MDAVPAKSWRISRLLRSVRGRLAALAGVIAVGAAALGIVYATKSNAPTPRANGASMAAALAGSASFQAAGVEAAPALSARSTEEPPRPVLWRVAQLADDGGVSLLEGAIARRPLLAALSSAGVPRAEAKRVTDALGEARDVDHFGAKDTFVIASEKASGHVVAFEVASSPVDVWQGREEADAAGTPKLRVRKLDLNSEQVRVRKAVLVSADLRASFTDAGFDGVDEVLKLLDDALDGHAELSDIRPGARLRLVATQERVEGAFVRWASIEAVEYLPATSTAQPVRVYRFGADDSPKHRGWYDAKGKQPYHGGWRSPVPFARIASRFNPRRMHPVLHVVMPHNGVDFAAPVGAPVYATASGTVVSVGMEGPCGNKVEIEHEGGISSVYCHLSRFAPGLRPGQRVEAQQLIAYVGQTGRVTGPHLHFGIKRNGVFVDPMTLRLDGVRVVPRARRADFDRLRGDLDVELDAIPLPAPPAAGMGETAPQPGVEGDTFFEEQ
jgi:murein DD-endopeptidase MepM/ murein hydrolase activator NlpD